MKLDKVFSSSCKILSAVIFLFAAQIGICGTKYHITFPGTSGISYSPSSFKDPILVGDTIEWDGAFNFHPLQDSIVPPGAAHFGPILSGTSFIYVITTPGTYWYHCNNHFPFGMHGTFTASAQSDVKSELQSNRMTAQNYPNPFASSTTIRYTLKTASEVNFRVIDLRGNEIYHRTIGNQNAGIYETNFDAGALASGTYIYQVVAADAVLSREMVVVKE